MGHAYTRRHAAALVATLPPGSRIHVAERPELAWDELTYLVASAEYSLRVLRWQRTEDGLRGRNKPVPVKTPADLARERSEARAATPEEMGAVADRLGIPKDRR